MGGIRRHTAGDFCTIFTPKEMSFRAVLVFSTAATRVQYRWVAIPGVGGLTGVSTVEVAVERIEVVSVIDCKV